MSLAMFPRFCDIASFEARAMSRGLSERRCAFAAMVTAVSVIPFASFARVLPVQGAIISASSGFFGPRGSAPVTVWIIPLPQRASTLEISSDALPNLVSVV